MIIDWVLGLGSGARLKRNLFQERLGKIDMADQSTVGCCFLGANKLEQGNFKSGISTS